MQYDFMAADINRNWLEETFFSKDKKQYWKEWQNKYEQIVPEPSINQFNFTPDFSALNYLPFLSFMLRIPFKLRKPYLSKDDRDFHLLDHPVRKDKVFKTPIVTSTSWKGALRAALSQMGYQEENEQIIRLFGNEREEEDHKKLKSGWLYFYPTFFDKIGLEVINPHDRKKGTSKRGPIYLECVPKDAKGEFVILYVPFGIIYESQVAKDLELVAKGIEAMLTVYGFGAKTSSGFGIVEDQFDSPGELAIRADIPELKTNTPLIEKLKFLNDDGTIKQEFLNDDRSFRTESQYKKILQRQNRSHNSKLYKEAKTWYEASKKVDPNSDLVKLLNFDNLSELEGCAKEIAEHLRQRKEISYDL